MSAPVVCLTLLQPDGQRLTRECLTPLLLGRDPGADLPLRGWRVARQHARLHVLDGGLVLDDLGTLTGTWVNGQRIARHGPLAPNDEIVIGSHVFWAMLLPPREGENGLQGGGAGAQAPLVGAQAMTGRAGAMTVPVGSVMDTALPLVQAHAASVASAAPAEPGVSAVVYLDDAMDAGARQARCESAATSDALALADEASSHWSAASQPATPAGPWHAPALEALAVPATALPPVTAPLAPEPTKPPQPIEPTALPSRERSTAPITEAAASAPPALTVQLAWRRRLHTGLLEAINLRRHDITQLSDSALCAEAGRIVTQLIAALAHELPAGMDATRLGADVVDEAVGLGPLEALLADPDISEIMVNRHDEIYVERAGRLARHPAGFSSEQAVLGVVERIVTPLGRRIDDSSPMVDARLPDGSRVHAIIAPIALRGAALTIRKFPQRRPDITDLLQGGSLSPAMAHFLQLAVAQRSNLLVAGGTGSGKTTLLNVLSAFIPAGERIITIEDAAELRLDHAHRISLEARPANVEGRGAVSIRDLVRNALRMRPDRIVVGECRGAEALDMLQAMNTGHEGSLTTLHANTPRDALARLETLILMAGMDLPLSAVREQVAASIDLIVQLTRAADGKRRIVAIVEVTGMEAGRIQMQTVFHHGNAGFEGGGLVPDCVERWQARGVACAPALFFGSGADGLPP